MVVNKLGLNMGCDPEFFFVDFKGRPVGAERVIPRDGLVYDSPYNNPKQPIERVGYGTYGKVKLDGFQAELNCGANACRAYTLNNIQSSIMRMNVHIAKARLPYVPVISRCVKVAPKELASLSPEARVFGCQPSFNAYVGGQVHVIKKNPEKYTYRSAGGHIHMGAGNGSATKTWMHKEADVIIKALDMIVGNTCVMMDRDFGNIERRKVYGLAGDYRKPEWGLEYRTLSNFWLKAPPIASMVMGYCRFAVSFIHDTSKSNAKNLRDAFFNLVPEKNIQTAINRNDYAMARDNYVIIANWISKHLSHHEWGWDSYGFAEKDRQFFLKFCDEIDSIFPDDLWTLHWSYSNEMHYNGWGEFFQPYTRGKIHG